MRLATLALLLLSAPLANAFKLTWEPPKTNVDGSPASIKGYTVTYAPVGQSMEDAGIQIDVPDPAATELEVPDLQANDYWVLVQAYNDAGKGPMAQLSNWPFPIGAPMNPMNVTIHNNIVVNP